MICFAQKKISNDFIFHRYKNGIKLIRPVNFSDRVCALNQLLAVNINIYFLDDGGNFCIQNEEHAKNMGCLSVQETLGKNISHFVTKESANLIRSNDIHVLKTEDYKIIEEIVKKNKCGSHGEDFSGLSFKMPWYSEDNKIIGIFGCTIVLGKHLLADSIETMRQLGLLNSDYTPTREPKFYFTKRQKEILQLMVRGKFSKEISNILKISQRTVQHYIDHMKHKVGVNSRSELIETVFDDFK